MHLLPSVPMKREGPRRKSPKQTARRPRGGAIVTAALTAGAVACAGLPGVPGTLATPALAQSSYTPPPQPPPGPPPGVQRVPPPYLPPAQVPRPATVPNVPRPIPPSATPPDASEILALPEAGPPPAVPATAPDQIVPDQVVVIQESQPTAEAMAAQLVSEGYAAVAQEALDALGVIMNVLAVPPGIGVAQAVADIAGQFPEAVAAPNTLYDPARAGTYGPGLIRWRAATATCGKGIRIGVLDSAADTRVPALKGRTVTVRSFVKDPRPPTNHGTAVATVLVGTGGGGTVPGLLPAAEVFVAGVFEHVPGKGTGRTVRSQTMALMLGLNWLAAQDVGVVNMSLAGPHNAVLQAAVTAVHKKAILMVGASGNTGPGTPPLYPAALAEVLAVTAVDADKRPYVYNTQGRHVAFTAPGVDLSLPAPEEKTVRAISGTSFAAPYVTGVVALWRAANPGTDALQALRELAAIALPLGGAGRDPVFGYGLIQAPAECR